MTVLFTRVATPVPGKILEAVQYAQARRDAVNKTFALHAEMYVRFGGPVGQVVMVETFESLDAMEKMRMAMYGNTVDGKIPKAPEGVFQSLDEFVWLKAP